MTLRNLFCSLVLSSGIVLAAGCGDRREVPAANAPGTAPGAHAESHDHGDHDDHAHTDEVTLTHEAVEKAGIRIEPASLHRLQDTLIAPARISFNLEGIAHVGSPVSGRAAQIKAKVGDEVKAGDVLLVIDSPELGEAQGDFLQKRAAVATAAPAVELARSAYERARSLHTESQGIALNEVQKREAEYKAAQGAVVNAQAALTAAENRLHLLGISQEKVERLAKSGEIDVRYPILAPIRGQVIERELTLGELVRPEREALLVLADLTTLWVLADVPEGRLKHIAVGAQANVRVGSMDDEALEGTVTYIAPQLDPATRTATVRIEIKSSRLALRPGMFAQAQIDCSGQDAAEPVLAVPEEAVQTVEGGPAVFVPVPGEENTFAKRSVKIGRSVGGKVAIFSGLKAGEPMVVSGSFLLKADLGKAGATHED